VFHAARKDFIRTHRSFIVSTRHIESFTAELIERRNMKIPIGKLFVNEVMKSCVEMVRVLSRGCGIE